MFIYSNWTVWKACRIRDINYQLEDNQWFETVQVLNVQG